MKSLRTILGALLLACAGTPTERDPGAVAAAYAAAGRTEEAQHEIERVVRIHPGDAALRRQAASVHASAGNVDRAVAHLESAIEIEPRAAETWIQLGQLEQSRQNLQDAYVAYRRATQLAPEDVRAVSGLALTADGLGFSDEARDAYARWAEIEERLDAGEPTPGASGPH